MQATPPASWPAPTTPPLPDKKENVLGALETPTSVPSSPEATPSSSWAHSLFWDIPVSEKTESILDTSVSLPEVEMPEISPVAVLPEVPMPLVEAPQTVPVIPENTVISPPIEAVSDVSPAEKKQDVAAPVVPTAPVVPLEKNIDAPVPAEKVETPDTPPAEPQKVIPKEEDPKLTQYLRADHVYQEMLRIESQEKIRLHLAIRYTLLMFAIFLVFAWIVSNRVIMFGFSEFVWLARIRDALFAVMAGLFSLTIWFGSVTWMRQIFLIALLRTLAIVFFAAVIIALYIPLW